MTFKNVDTPCIGICSTVYGDHVCRGCKRFANEIIEWNTYNPSQKSDILARLNMLSTEIAKRYLLVTDAALLQQACKNLNVRYREEFAPLTWAYMLIKMRSDKIDDAKQYGFEILPEFIELTLQQIAGKIDLELFMLSEQFLQTKDNLALD